MSGEPVIDTAGCPRALTVPEQLARGSLARHPLQDAKWPVDDWLRQALEYEGATEVEAIDCFREDVIKRWLARSWQLQAERQPFLESRGFGACVLRSRVHYPLLFSFLVEMN